MSSLLSKLINLAGNITGTLGVGNGGTGIASGTSGGVPYFSSTSAMSSSAALTANGVVLGGGAGSAPSATAVGTNGQLLVGVTGGAPAWGSSVSAVTTFTSGIVPSTGASTLTAYSKGAAFTPQVKLGTTPQTVTPANGRWWQIGSVIYFNLRVTFSKSGTGGLTIILNGLANTPSFSGCDYHVGCLYFSGIGGLVTKGSSIWGDLGANGNVITIYTGNTTGAGVQIADTDLSASTDIWMSGWYGVD